MEYYFSGVNRKKLLELLALENASAMMNILSVRQPEMQKAIQWYPEVKKVLDSGAFSGNTDLKGYGEFVRTMRFRYDWCANLDVIGDQQQSDINWETLRAYQADTLWIYQVEGGRNLDYLSSRADAQKFVGIGGLVPILRRSVNEAMDLIEEIGIRLNAVGGRGHFFGVGSPNVLRRFSSMTWFNSADSIKWLCGMKAREIIRRDGTQISADTFGLSFSSEEITRQNVRQILGWLEPQPLQLAMF
jgi:hypothetical protein